VSHSHVVRVGCGLLLGGAALFVPALARAQQKAPPKKGQTIEIRGQVPTPQVVTVRPREVPVYDRQLLAPAFYDGAGSAASAAGVRLVPESQLTGAPTLDTTPAGIARGGGAPGGAPLLTSRDSAQAARAPDAARAAANAAEIDAMRRELAMRRARLDSLRRALDEKVGTPVELAHPPVPAARRMSAADSAARAAEIESIRRELEYRRQRLDSLQREVKNMGRGKKPAPPKRTTPDTTAIPSRAPHGRD
jgi:hypothetical protein